MGLRDRIRRRLLRQAHTPPAPPWSPPRRTTPPPSIHDYVPRHPDLLQHRPEHLAPRFAEALQTGQTEALMSLIEEVHPGIYAFQPMSDAWRQRLLEEVLHFDQWAFETGCRYDPPNSMNHYGVILDQIGFQQALHDLTQTVVRPLAAALFPEVGGDSLDEHHGFVVEYRKGADVDLGFHVDASDVTLNLCLGSVFSGGELYFEGRRCAHHRQTGCSSEDRFIWAHQPGVAILHAGKHRHGATSIQGGERVNLILWCRSSTNTEPDECPTWCQESMAR